MNKARARTLRFEAMKACQCLACQKNEAIGLRHDLLVVPEIHHLNFGGKAGGKRLGDDFTLALCRWHHRGIPPFPGVTSARAALLYGPSLALQSKLFRGTYGSDDELLKMQNRLINLENAA